MVRQDHILVSIISEGRVLTEYDEPDRASLPSNTHVKYIEVSTGARFGVKFQLWPGFDFHGADGVYWKFCVDDDETRYFGTLREPYGYPSNGKIKIHLTDVYDTVYFKGESKESSFQFGPLSIAEEDDNMDLNPNALQKLGSIRVEAYRGKRKRVTPHPIASRPFVRDEISERVLKGKSLKNNVKFPANGKTAQRDDMICEEWIPMQGPHGKIYSFTFHYRTKRILQSLGVLPRTPSPPVDAGLIIARADAQRRELKNEANDGLFNAQREIETLRAEIQELRRSTSTAMTTPGTSRNTSVKPEPVDLIDGYRGIKPEIKAEAANHTSPNSITVPGITIDLTETSTPAEINRKRRCDASPSQANGPPKRARHENVVIADEEVMEDASNQSHDQTNGRTKRKRDGSGSIDSAEGAVRPAKKAAVDLTGS